MPILNPQGQYTLSPGDTPIQGTPSGSFATINGQNYAVPALQQATPPTNASAITQTGNVNVPIPSPYFGNTAPAAAATQGAQKTIDLSVKSQEEAAAQAKAQSDALDAQNSQAKGYLATLINGNPSQTARTNAQAETGINPTNYYADQQARIVSIGKLQEDYNATQTQMNNEIQQARDNAGGQLESGVNQTVSKIQTYYSSLLSEKSANINAQSAVLQALQGNFSSAQTFVNQAVNDATADQKNKVDLLGAFIQQNDTEISKLDSKYQNAITTAYNTKKDELTTARTAANDYYDNLYKDAQTKYLNAQSGALNGGIKFTPSQKNNGAVNAGVDASVFNTYPPDVQNFYINTPAKALTAINDAISQVKSGDATAADVTTQIDASNLSPAVKQFFKDKVNGTSSPTTQPSLISKAWDAITGFFSPAK